MADNIYAKLQAIQSELFVPKGKKNEFGGFNYRSCEDILKVLKPLLTKNKCALHLNNRVVSIGDRTYVEATATLADCEGSGIIDVTAQAREPISKKGMDEMQVTGATSSYARKYALAGLFCIDNEKDADTMDTRDDGTPSAKIPAGKQANPGREAWSLFKVKYSEMDDAELKLAFANAIKEALGMKSDANVSTKDITSSQWAKVLDHIRAA